MRQLFYYKMPQKFIKKASGFSLQNATVIANCDNFITKCDVYCKLRQYNRQEKLSFKD